MIDLDLHRYKDKLEVLSTGGKVYIRDIIRKKRLVLQPEELVRQLTIHHLIDYGYPKSSIQVEKKINVNGMTRRYDIVVYDRHLLPYMLIECKSHKVGIAQTTFDQIAQYNIEMRAPYLLVTNGVQSYCCHLDFDKKKVTYLSKLPMYRED